MAMSFNKLTRLALLLALVAILSACAGQPGLISSQPAGDGEPAAPLVIYSGRNENLVGPLLEQFSAQSGIPVQARYGDTAEMAATILEEGRNSPADVYFGQDAGALGALAMAGRLAELPAALLAQVDPRFRDDNGRWVGASGRARVLVYNTDLVQPEELPQDIWGLTEPQWRSRIGWAPSNGSFQAFVTTLRVLEGDDAARRWLEGMLANEAQVYAGNSAIVEAVASGEISAGLVNHYYLYQHLAQKDANAPLANYYFPGSGAGALINVAGAGILDTSRNQAAAERFITFLLSQEAQQYFAEQTNEYPLAGENVALAPGLLPLSQIAAPAIDLGNLDDLQGTLELLQAVGALN
jgi:iron(III) transport system substrate-binding protein